MSFGNCVTDGVHDLNTNNKLIGDDDVNCADTSNNTVGFVPNIGCFGTDTDFSGVPYQLDCRAPTATRPSIALCTRRRFRSRVLSSLRRSGGQSNYARVAFEANMPRIEAADFGGNCNRTTGAGCTNPPPNANFYPIYSIQAAEGSCRWSLGGPFISGTTDSFGGKLRDGIRGRSLQVSFPERPAPVHHRKLSKDIVQPLPKPARLIGRRLSLLRRPRSGVPSRPLERGHDVSFRATLRHHYCRYLPLIECRHSTSFTACD